MKRLIVAAILAVLAPRVVLASPYFRTISGGNVQTSVGALFSPKGASQTQGIMDVARGTHSTQDGSIIPAAWRGWIAPEAWTPLQVGGGGTGGTYVANIGSSINILPQIQALAIKGLDAFGNTMSLAGLRSALSSQSAVTFAAGPSFAVNFCKSGVLLPASQWQGAFRWYAGAGWKF